MHLSAIPSSRFTGLISDIYGPGSSSGGEEELLKAAPPGDGVPADAIIIELSPEALAYLEGNGEPGEAAQAPIVIDVDITNNIYLPHAGGADEGPGESGQIGAGHHTHGHGHVRKARLRRIWNKIKALVKSARRLDKRAGIFDAVASDLKKGRTPRSYRRTARMVEKLANNRAHKWETKALNLEHEAEELEDLGGSFNLKRAKLKRKAAANLYELADDIRTKAEERADKNRHKAKVLDRILDKLEIDWQDMDQEELEETGQLLEDKAEIMRSVAETRFRRARRLRRRLRRLIRRLIESRI